MLIKIKGINLTQELINYFNYWQFKEFKKFGASKETISSENRLNFSEDIFYFLFDDNKKILALGQVLFIEPIIFMNEKYKIAGISGIIATKKGNGYGKILVTQIREDIEFMGLSCFSFCEFDIFYEKCGFTVLKNSMNRFTYEGFNNTTEGPHILCLNGKDNLIKKIIKNPNQQILIPIPWW